MVCSILLETPKVHFKRSDFKILESYTVPLITRVEECCISRMTPIVLAMMYKVWGPIVYSTSTGTPSLTFKLCVVVSRCVSRVSTGLL